MIYDISPPITDSIAVFPGDTPPTREVLMDMRKGDALTLSTLRSTVHVGAHADAPSHYGADAPTIDQVELQRYVGPCQVVRVAARRHALLAPDAISAEITAPRVLSARTHSTRADQSLPHAAGRCEPARASYGL